MGGDQSRLDLVEISVFDEVCPGECAFHGQGWLSDEPFFVSLAQVLSAAQCARSVPVPSAVACTGTGESSNTVISFDEPSRIVGPHVPVPGET